MTEPVGHILSSGRIVDFLMKLDPPVFAWPGESIFRVVLHGHGIRLEVEDADPIIGFVVTFFIAAKNVRAAETKAIERARDRWETFYPDATGELGIEVEETERLAGRFLRRSRLGMAFYSKDE